MAERKTNAPFLILPLLAFAAGLILLNGVLAGCGKTGLCRALSSAEA